MKRYLILGLLVLLALPGVGIWASTWMERTGEEALVLLEQAVEAEGRGDVREAAALVERAHGGWRRRERLAAWLWEHRELEEIGLGFRGLEGLLSQPDTHEFGRACLELCQRIDSLCRKQWLSLENIF